ncbi:unnamed protein product [Adineta steineri]|uniref:Uncharacterized protein n=1 Tax=Adineta steineri TaxID=433720 RepID=A0A815I0Q8_9BILA|nr:unnamed protein product [Adineta steineri]CAF1359008.1 unnamed protein product [Adineta steineri]
MDPIDDINSTKDPCSGGNSEYTDDLGSGELFDYNNVDSSEESTSGIEIKMQVLKDQDDENSLYAANRETEKTCSSIIKSILCSRECLACTISTISMLVGILIVVYTMPKQPGMIFLS